MGNLNMRIRKLLQFLSKSFILLRSFMPLIISIIWTKLAYFGKVNLIEPLHLKIRLHEERGLDYS